LDKNKIYFASDFHLGDKNFISSRNREKKIISWLDLIKTDAKSIYLIGDIFDFWYEYKAVVPKGHVRLLGKLANLTDLGIDIHIIVGNHDLWMKDYLSIECGVKIHYNPIIANLFDTKVYISHGDGIGPGNNSFKLIKSIFKNKTCQWLFSRIHPNLAFKIARSWSNRSRIHGKNDPYLGTEKESQEQFCISHNKKHPEISYYILGHRHIPLDIKISDYCRYINTGDWINHCSYAVMDKEKVKLKYFK